MKILILLSILIVFIIYCIIKKKDLLSPAILFFLIILTTYIIACLRLSDLQQEYDFKYSIIILFLIFCFILGCIFGNRKKKKENKTTYNNYKFKMCIYLIFLLVVGSFFVMWLTLGAPPAISKIDRAKYFMHGFRYNLSYD